IMKALLAAAAVLLLCASPTQAGDVSPEEQAEVIRAAATLIEARYVDADKAAVIANDVRRMADTRPSPMKGKAFAEEMTERFREVSGDGHLGLSYSEVPIPEQDGDARFDAGEL